MSHAFKVILSNEAWESLVEMARTDMRTVGGQAAFLITSSLPAMKVATVDGQPGRRENDTGDDPKTRPRDAARGEK